MAIEEDINYISQTTNPALVPRGEAKDGQDKHVSGRTISKVIYAAF